MKDYFVMLQHPTGGYVPMINSDGDIALYDTEEEAREEAKANPLGENYGFEIFQRVR